jgi:hypothetical protein
MKFFNKHIASFGILLCVAGIFTARASVPYGIVDSGNATYAKGNYAKAITFYSKFLDGVYESPEVYYNLGNCYYRSNEIGKAILYYEKAKRLSPGDADIEFNLQLANQKTVDKIGESQLFFVSWWDSFVNLASERGWAIICIVLFCITLVLVILYLLSPRLIIRQLGFWGGLFMLVLCFFAFMLAHQQYRSATTHDTAIVMSASVTVKGAPADNSTQLFLIHEGAKVRILKTEGTWVEVKLANGNQGWLLASDISAI